MKPAIHFYQFLVLFILSKCYEVESFDFKVVLKPFKCVLVPSTLRIVKTQLLCPSEPNKNLTNVLLENIPKPMIKYELFLGRPQPRGSYLKDFFEWPNLIGYPRR
jgi:hypothetical protein